MTDRKLTDNEIKKAREVSLEEQIEHYNERLKETLDSYYRRNTNGAEDPLEICVLRESAVLISKLESIINRLQAENEKWQGGYMTQKQEIANLEIELKAMRGAANSYKAENERLREKCENTQIGYNFAQDDIKTLKKDKYKLQKALNQSEDYRVIAKAEAYKEFAEKLENRILSMLTTATLEEKEIICACIGTNNNLLKELVGE